MVRCALEKEEVTALEKALRLARRKIIAETFDIRRLFRENDKAFCI